MLNPATVAIFFFFNDTATTEIYTLSLHDALPICHRSAACARRRRDETRSCVHTQLRPGHHHRLDVEPRSEEHTSELQSPDHLVCRLLLEKKKKQLADATCHISGESAAHSNYNVSH